jgi:hypothetical protein
MKFKSLVAVAAMVAAGAASAAGGVLSLSGTSASTIDPLGFDVWTFSVPVNSFGSITGFSTSGPTLTGVSFTTAANAAVPGLLESAFLPYGKSFSFTSLAAGNYKFTIAGAATSAYSINANVAAVPVPEPGSYVLALAGLGIAGLMLRRRSA